MAVSTAKQQIQSNLALVHEEIDRVAAGRSIRLVCVTKYARADWVEALLEAGATELGENLLPRAQERFTCFNEFGYSFTRHLLGAQQTRKVQSIPAACDLFQALDRHRAAEVLQAELAARSGRLDVLLEVNIDGELQKHGWSDAQALEAASQLSTQCPNLNLRGMMCLPQARHTSETAGEFERRTRNSFSRAASLFARIGAALDRTAQWDTLSMGMSQDYAWAIAEGATMVRVGSALFVGLEG